MASEPFAERILTTWAGGIPTTVAMVRHILVNNRIGTDANIGTDRTDFVELISGQDDCISTDLFEAGRWQMTRFKKSASWRD
jgi:hypothetical protein